MFVFVFLPLFSSVYKGFVVDFPGAPPMIWLLLTILSKGSPFISQSWNKYQNWIPKINHNGSPDAARSLLKSMKKRSQQTAQQIIDFSSQNEAKIQPTCDNKLKDLIASGGEISPRSCRDSAENVPRTLQEPGENPPYEPQAKSPFALQLLRKEFVRRQTLRQNRLE